MKALLKNKKLLIALCSFIGVVAIVVCSVMATVAYLTSSAAVSNVFTIGNVGITMTESKVNPNGTRVDETTRVDTNTYHLVPDTTYIKDPTIFVNEGSENSYLFVLVRNDLEKIEDKASNDANRRTIAEQLADYGWAKYTPASTGWVYVYVGAGNVPAGDVDKTAGEFTGTASAVGQGSYQLFENFTIAQDADVSTYGAAKITLTGVAIQNSGFNSIGEAWEAVVATYPYIHTGNAGN